MGSRTERYIARLEALLPRLADEAARRDFVAREMDTWEERYARFIRTEGVSLRSGDAAGQPTAFDFSETLTALGAVHARLDRSAGRPPSPPPLRGR